MGQPYGFFVAGVIAYLIASSVLATTSPVGTTSGSFDVNANGAATYTVALQTPPGINGLEPKLGLVYDSQQGNGLLGVGWSLSGLSVVSRCAGNIALDGARSGIEFNSTRFCWDGQRLLPKTDAAGVQETGGDADGTYWEFRTEIDNFARVRAYGSLNDPLKFKIWTKDGRLSSYAVRLRPQSKGTLLWALDRMEDRKANFLTVSYAVDDLGGEYTPAAIEYGGGGAPLRRVEFITDTTRGDKFTKYLNGAKLFTTRRLNSVTTKVNGLTTRSYNLYYSAEATTAARSLLTSLQECGSDGVCYGKPLTFTARSTGTTAFADGTSVALTLGNEFGQWNQLADINGDGLIDLFRVINAGAGTVVVNLRQSNGSYGGDITTTGVITNETVTGAGFNQWNELADVNGDGIADIFRVIIPGSGGIAEARIHLGNPNGTFQTAALSLPGAVTYGTEGFRFWNQLVDMDGDGLMDVFNASSGSSAFSIKYGKIDSATNVYSLENVTCSGCQLAIFTSIGGFRETNQLADMNGDGIVDIFRVTDRASGKVKIFFGRGRAFVDGLEAQGAVNVQSFQSSLGVGIPYGAYFNYLNQLVDVNADGVTDIVTTSWSLKDQSKIGRLYSSGETSYIQFDPQCKELSWVTKCSYRLYEPVFEGDAQVRFGLGDGVFTSAVSTAGVIEKKGFSVGAIYHTSKCAISNGFYDCSPSGYNVGSTKGFTHYTHFADLDGDGYIDILSADDNGAVSVAYGKGNGIFNPRVFAGVSVPLDSAKGFRANNQLADLNGDGLVDLFTANGGTGTPKLSQRRLPGLLESVRDGNGSVTSIVYKPLTDASVYTRSTGGDAYPLHKVSVPQNVVAASSVRDGDAAPATFEYTRSYRYADARIDMKRGWLGFAEVTRTDHSAGLETITAFNQSFPYTGRIKQQSVRALSAAAGKYLSKATYGWNNRVNTGVNAAGKVHFVHQTSNTQTRYEPNANYSADLTTTTTFLDNNADGWPYDGYGNPETVQVAHSDGHTLTTVYRNTYAAALYPGQLSAQDTTVTHATPAAGSRTRLTRDIYYGDGLLQDSTSQPDAGNENTELRSKTAYTYDGSGRVLSIAVTGSDPMYDVSGNASHVNVTRQTSFLYSEVGTILTTTKTTAVTGTANHVETLKFDTRHGGLIEAVDPAGIKTARGYDGFARKLSETRYSGSTRPVTTASEYISVGAAGCPSMTGVVYCVKTTRYGVTSSLAPIYVQLDALERERRSITQDALGSWIYQDTQYDAAGRTWRVSRPYYSGGSLLWTSTSYDLAGRPLQITAPNGAVTTQGYQGLATTVTRTGGLSQSTTTVLDSQNKPIKVVDALNNATNYTYAPFGLLQKITDAKGNAIVNSYDAFGNKTAVTDPDIGTWQFRYNAFGELKWQKDAKAQITSFNYDRRGRLTARTEGTGTGAVTTAWVYDTTASGAGRLDNVSRADALRRYTYDTLTGLVSGTTLTVAGAAYGTVTAYDDLARPASLTYPADALKVNYTYHVNGALKKISDAASGVGYWEATAYNADGFSTAETWGNGLTGTRAYDAATGALTAITTGGVQRLSYGYYTLGNLQTRRNELHNVTETFYYDLLDRLKRVESNAAGIKNYDYDAIGNITFKSGTGYYSYGARPHAVTQVSNSSANLNGDADNSGSLTAADVTAIRNDILGTQAAPGKPDCNLDIAVNILDILCVNNRVLNQASLSGTNYSYGYDANGNLTSGGGRTLTYTAFNMPLTVDYNGLRESYGYDGDHSRVTKEVRNIATGAVTEKTLYLGKAYERIDRGGAVEERFYISAGDRAVAVVNKSGGATAALYLHTDLLGSVDTVTNAAKTVVDDLSFDAFGLTRKPNWQDGTPATAYTKTTRGYTGHEMDLASGLVNMNARLYDPWLGRFVQADSVIPDVYNPQGINPYSYVLNNPFGYTDPTGHEYIGTFNGVAGFNDGSGSGGMVAAYNTGSGEYSFGDGSRIDAQGNYYAPSSYGSTLYGHTVANWASGAQQANGVGPELARPSTGSSGLSNYGGNHSTVLTGWSSTLPCTYQCHRNGHAETPTYNTGKDISLPLAHATLGVIATGGFAAVAGLPGGTIGILAYEASTSDGPVAKGALPSAGGVVRQFEQTGDKVYYRVFSGDADVGGWLTAVPPRSSAWAQEALALPPGNKATMIQEVLVPNGTLLERSRAIPMPEWGRMRGGAEQFELLEPGKIPRQNFGPGRPLP